MICQDFIETSSVSPGNKFTMNDPGTRQILSVCGIVINGPSPFRYHAENIFDFHSLHILLIAARSIGFKQTTIAISVEIQNW